MFTGYVSREIKQTINSYRSLNTVCSCPDSQICRDRFWAEHSVNVW